MAVSPRPPAETLLGSFGGGWRYAVDPVYRGANARPLAYYLLVSVMLFKVQLDAFHGPLDLLLYLVRKEELEIAELPLALVTEQYLTFVELLQRLDVDAVGEFLDVASLLIEIKSRRVLPQAEEAAEEVDEPQEDLVQRLLEFKAYRDAAGRLEERGAEWRLRRSRIATPARTAPIDPANQPLVGVELWDLVSAFARVMRDRLAPEPEPTSIVYDETPVHVHMQQIDRRLREIGGESPQSLSFTDLFPEGPIHKSTLIGLFLAVLELIRYRHALAVQADRYGEIVLSPGPEHLPEGFGELPQQAA